MGARTLELALELAYPRLRGAMLQFEGGAQFGGNSLQRDHALPQALAALVHRGEASRECVPLLLGVLRGRMCLLDAPLPAVALGAVATTGAHGDLLGLDPQLLLGVLALLDAAQLQLALGELRGDVLARTLTLDLARAQIGEVGLERAHRRLGRLGATQQGRIAQPGAAGTAFGERVVLLLLRGTFAPRLVFLGDHHCAEYGRDRTGSRTSHLAGGSPAAQPDNDSPKLPSLPALPRASGRYATTPPRAAATPCATAATTAR